MRAILTSRESHPADTCIDVGYGVKIGGGNFAVIAGPCSVEGESLLSLAHDVRLAGATMLRGGAFKPRTSPYDFQGLGTRALELLMEASHQEHIPVVVELTQEALLDTYLELGIHVIQIGARNAQNFSLLKAVGKTQTPVLLKRGMGSTIEELLLAAEYIMREGNRKVLVCERGIRTFEDSTRYTFDVSAIPVVKHDSHLPIIADPSHAAGTAAYVADLACAAVAAGADGLEIEVHADPPHALSDGEQALTPAEFSQLMQRVRSIREALCG